MVRWLVTLVVLVNTSTLQEKVDKHLYKFYDEIVLLENKQVFLDGHIFNITGKTDRVYVGDSRSRFEAFTYMAIIDPDSNTIKHVKILIYRENYGGEIASKRWLRQFIGMSKPKHYVDAISGATISVNSLKVSLNKLILSHKQYLNSS